MPSTIPHPPEVAITTITTISHTVTHLYITLGTRWVNKRTDRARSLIPISIIKDGIKSKTPWKNDLSTISLNSFGLKRPTREFARKTKARPQRRSSK